MECRYVMYVRTYVCMYVCTKYVLCMHVLSIVYVYIMYVLCMYICMYVTYVCVCTYVCIVCVYSICIMYVCMYVCVRMYVLRMYICMYVLCMYVRMSCMYVLCMYVLCMYVMYVCECTYVCIMCYVCMYVCVYVLDVAVAVFCWFVWNSRVQDKPRLYPWISNPSTGVRGCLEGGRAVCGRLALVLASKILSRPSAMLYFFRKIGLVGRRPVGRSLRLRVTLQLRHGGLNAFCALFCSL